ncbi:MAG: zinc-ribbon domain-containing protein [Ruminococcaceae bacterium]|nr:zinc-ribbon domain-containing protein [Oscillospiraceae bacterium]
MKSIKPGRGPSFMSGIMCIFVGLFGVVWTVVSASAGGGVFALFGIVFIAVAVIQAIYNFKNATGKNRYSAYDITDENEEPDPLNHRFGDKHDDENKFCPYCGNSVEDDFEFCNKCGKKLP